jgi:hypothetical protein
VRGVESVENSPTLNAKTMSELAFIKEIFERTLEGTGNKSRKSKEKKC